MAENTQLTVATRGPGGIELYSRIDKPLDAITQIGTFFAKSGMFGCDKVEQGMVLAMECLATNKQPSVIARTYHIMDGKLSKKALAALAEFRSAGGKHKWLKIGADGKEASLELTMDGSVIVSSFTIEQARAAGLVRPKSGWEKNPANMLRARCISNGVAMLAPEIFAGDVEDEDSPAPRAAEPLLTERPVVSVAEPATVAREPVAAVVDAEIVKETQAVDSSKPATSAETTAQPASSPSPAASSYAPAAEVKPFQAEAKGDRLTAETQQAIIAAVGESNMDALIKWLVKQGWLTAEQNLSNLSVPRANKILTNPAGVLRTIGASK
jgi:hypothetical protein